jgi:RNA polymerase sigma factor (sigma-70 family)
MARAGLGAAFRQLRGLFGGGSVVGLEDGQLLARYASDRDEAAFEALIERHGPMVLTICRAVLKNEHDSEDAFQATFLVLARKAGSIRGADALGGWLHRVAYRASVQASVEAARRRRKEAEAQAMAAQFSPRSEPDRELQALLHAEIDRLPDSQRLPVVLCDLEGLTYEQAANQLRWTVPTLRNRLARGRQRLKTRLTRRCLMAPAIAGLAPVPPALVKSTLSAATCGVISTGAALLARTLLKGMLMTKLKVAGTWALATLVLVSAGVIAAGSGQLPNEPKPAPKSAAKAEIAIQEPRKPVEPVEVRGIVLTPNGKPVAGAKVWANVRAPVPETTSGPDGRFLLRIPARNPAVRYGEDFYFVSASAPGFGLEWTRTPLEPRPSDEATIRLVAEGPPIEGRIIDLEGRPVAGAIVKVKYVWVAYTSSFAAWAAKAKAQEVQSPSEDLLALGFSTPKEVVTGADGRFHLTGIGGDRVATLLVSGPTIASTEINVLTYDGPEIQTTPPVQRNVVRFAPPKTTVFHAPKFEAVAIPTRPIEGVVRDKDTGRPIEGLTLQAAVEEPRSLIRIEENVRTTTDAQGRYRLEGMPVAAAYRLFLSQPPGQRPPYARASFPTPDNPPATGPIAFDIALKRAVVVRGRVTDKTSGRPVLGYVDPYIFADNPFAAEYSLSSEPRQGPIWTDPDGRFEVITPPGQGLIAFRSNRDDFLAGLGAEAIKGFDRGRFPTRGRVCTANSYDVLAEVNLDPKAESATMDLQVDPGRSLDLAIVDPEGRPIEGLRVEGTSPRSVNIAVPEKAPTVKIRGLDPSKPRRVTVFHDGRKLVGSIWLKGDEVGPLTVRLGPWGTIVGRFVDAGGKGLGPWKIFSTSDAQGPQTEGVGYLPGMMVSPGLTTDAEGRFRIEGLVPGLKYLVIPENMQSRKSCFGERS